MDGWMEWSVEHGVRSTDHIAGKRVEKSDLDSGERTWYCYRYINGEG